MMGGGSKDRGQKREVDVQYKRLQGCVHVCVCVFILLFCKSGK